MTTIALFATHGEPHCGPLGVVDGGDDGRDLVHEGDGAGDVVENFYFADLFPRHLGVVVAGGDGDGGKGEGGDRMETLGGR